MKIYNMREAELFGMAMSTTQLISTCAKDSRYYKGLNKKMPDFSAYDYVLPYFFDVLKSIKKYVNEHGTLIDNTQEQVTLREGLKLLKKNVLSDENGKSVFVGNFGHYEEEPRIINNQSDAELFTTLLAMQENILFNASNGDPYYLAMSVVFPSVFDKHFNSKSMKEIACEICNFLTNVRFRLGALPSALSSEYKKLQKLMNKQK